MSASRPAKISTRDADRGPEPRASAARQVIVVIPAFNEARFIGSVVLQARQHAARVIVVDDGSTDGTGTIARAAGAEVLQHPQNLGKAAALSTGFLHVRKLIARRDSPIRVVGVLDGDGQHQPDELPQLAAPILSGQADLVVGSRFLGVKSRIPRWRIFGQRALTLATNLGSGFSLTDSQSGFRAFAPQVLEAMDFDSEGFSVESEMQFLAGQHGFHVKEVPIRVVYAEPPKRNPIDQGLRVINGILRLTGQYRPLAYFGIPGILLLMMGIGLGLWVVELFYNTGQLAAGLALICLLLSILGMILISTGVTLHSVRGLLHDILDKHH